MEPKRRFSRAGLLYTISVSCVLLGACELPEPPKVADAIPMEYASEHMPQGWWNNEVILEEGRLLYLGLKKSDVNCAQCHGENGKPGRSGPRNFQDTIAMHDYSDSHLLWKISEGVPFSQMRAYKGKLTQDEIWKVIAFVSTLGLNGLKYDPSAKDWIPFD